MPRRTNSRAQLRRGADIYFGISLRHFLSALTCALNVARFLVIFCGPPQVWVANFRAEILSERDAEAMQTSAEARTRCLSVCIKRDSFGASRPHWRADLVSWMATHADSSLTKAFRLFKFPVTNFARSRR